MRMNVENATQLFSIIEKTKQISKVPFSDAEFRNWIHTINTINALPHGMMLLNGYSLTEYGIPSEIKDLVVPSRIQFTVSDISTDYKSSDYSTVPTPDTLAGCLVLSPVDFNLVSIGINGCKKKNNAALSIISEVRVSKTLADVHETCFVGGTTLCKVSTTNFHPLSITLSLMKTSVYTEDITSMLQKWFMDQILSIKQ